jgi:DNA polymerase-3 subunit gamma/tau
VQSAEKGAQAAEMVLVRLAFAADLPTPDEALRSLGNGNDGNTVGPGGGGPAGGGMRMSVAAEGGARASAAPRHEPSPRASAQAVPQLAKFEDIVAFAAAKRDLQTKHAIEQFVRPVSMQEGRLEISLTAEAPPGLAQALSAKLLEWTGKRWLVSVSAAEGAPTIVEQKAATQNALESDARKDPLVAAVLKRFPGAEIVSVRRRDDASGKSEPDSPLEMPPDPPDEEPRD